MYSQRSNYVSVDRIYMIYIFDRRSTLKLPRDYISRIVSIFILEHMKAKIN